MADFKIAYETLKPLEFGSSKNALNKLPTENNYTFQGIYREAHPEWGGWKIVDEILKNHTVEEASKILYDNDIINDMVEKFYMENYWRTIKGDHINNQHIAQLIFIFGVNTGYKNSVKKAQQLLNVTVDGIIGNMTLNALNSCDSKDFIEKYKEAQRNYYKDIVNRKPSKSIFLKNWLNRVERS